MAATDDDRTLHGSCSCGRNQYWVQIPQSSQHIAQVLFDNSSANRRTLASPLTAWLRVPLTWYQSTTFSFYPDETHRSIRRTFTSQDHSTHSTARQFCGYCGTPLSAWDERTRESAEFISLTLGSLVDGETERLEEWGVLDGSEEEEDNEEPERDIQQRDGAEWSVSRPPTNVGNRGASWFEDRVEDSRLGRIKRRRGHQSSSDGAVQVEWEVLEWTEGDDQVSASPAKRKRGNDGAAMEEDA